ncbi:MAG TPA: sigma-70 family RNA polymerase sigma factor [Acidimicrobiales bacterium]|nr:sigma-70 family RNA polymerase sigma factor [Acidimicrobiales bacterium]
MRVGRTAGASTSGPRGAPGASGAPGATTVDSDVLRLYLEDIGRYSLLSRADEQRLGRDIEAGRAAKATLDGVSELNEERLRELLALVADGARATEALVSANLRLVVSLAKRYRSSGLALSDLVQEGNIGLMHAAEKFDFRKGFKFSTYAAWWIRQAIGRCIANTGRTIRLPVHAGQKVGQVQAAQAGLEAELGRPPTVAELAAETGLAAKKVRETLALGHPPMSIFEPLGADGDGVLGDVLEDRTVGDIVDEVIAVTFPAQVMELLKALDDKERQVVCLRYGLLGDKTVTIAGVAAILGVTEEGIRHIERRALKKLRSVAGTAGLAELIAG